jgi:hypothetical protein
MVSSCGNIVDDLFLFFKNIIINLSTE